MRPIDAAAPGSGLQNWYNTFCVLSWREIWSSLGSWLEAVEPEIGPRTRVNVDLVRAVDRNQIMPAARRREEYFRRLQDLLGPAGLLCLPTTPTLAPFKRLPGGRRPLPIPGRLLSPDPGPHRHRRPGQAAPGDPAPGERRAASPSASPCWRPTATTPFCSGRRNWWPGSLSSEPNYPATFFALGALA